MRFFSVQYFGNLVTRNLNFLNKASGQAHGYINIMAFMNTKYIFNVAEMRIYIINLHDRKEIHSTIFISNYKRVNLYPFYFFETFTESSEFLKFISLDELISKNVV